MEWFPEWRLGWLNGWIPLALLYAVFGFLLWRFPREVVSRLYDRSGWSRTETILTATTKVFAFIYIGLVIFTALKIGHAVFILGSVVYAVGLVGFVVALLNFASTSPDQPVTSGLYRISRNPQAITFSLAGLGVCLMVGSGVALLAWFGALFSSHLRILAEENTCLRQYGDSYRGYMQRVPRYFLFF